MAKLREYVLSSGRIVFGGRDSGSNDELVFSAKPADILLHSKIPGSPFVNAGENPSKEEIKESAVFCAKYSQDWRDNKRDVVINLFKKSDMNKAPKMKEGCWAVKKEETIKVKKADILKFEEKQNNGNAN